MDRIFGTNRAAQNNPDYALEDPQRNGYHYKDDPKSGYEHPQAAQLYDGELSEKEEDDTPYAGSGDQSSFKRIGLHILQLTFTIALIGLILAIPIFITMKAAFDLSLDNTIQNKNFVFWFFVWMEVIFAGAAIANICALIFPYIFYIVAKWINPAHRRCKFVVSINKAMFLQSLISYRLAGISSPEASICLCSHDTPCRDLLLFCKPIIPLKEISSRS